MLEVYWTSAFASTSEADGGAGKEKRGKILMSPKRKVVRQTGFWPPAKCEDCGRNLNFHRGDYFCTSDECNPKEIREKVAPLIAAVKKQPAKKKAVKRAR